MIAPPYAIDLANEMTHCVSTRLGWTTTTFEQSTPSLVEELLICRRQLTNGILTQPSFENVRVRVEKQLPIDPGMGDSSTRAMLSTLIPANSNEFIEGSFKYTEMQASVAGIKDNYLMNWQTEFCRENYSAPRRAQGNSIIPASAAAAFITTFLLDAGLSAEYLVKLVDYRLSPDCPELTLNEFVGELVKLYATGQGLSEIMAVIDQSAVPIARAVQGWLSRAKVDRWFDENGFTPPQGIHGGILFTSAQWDIYGALQDVSDSLRRISYRTFLKFGRAPSFHRLAWIKGVRGPRRIPNFSRNEERMPAYQMETPSLVMPASDNRLEVSVQFLQAASATGGATAVGMLWVALETLLFVPGERTKMKVVERATDIALAAFIRSDLQNSIGLILSRCRADPIGLEMAALPYNERPRRLVTALQSREYESLTNSPVRTHLGHTARLLDVEYIDKLRESFRQCLTDLYRQRNLVLHGGITDGPLLKGTLRCALPLVTAILNRYARVREHSPIDPQAAASEARKSIIDYESGVSPDILDFLGL